jgi:hypothetical protein
MPHEVKYSNDKSPEQRIRDRLKPSGAGLGADHSTTVGSGPTRTITHVHHGSSQHGANRLGRNADGSDGDKR